MILTIICVYLAWCPEYNFTSVHFFAIKSYEISHQWHIQPVERYTLLVIPIRIWHPQGTMNFLELFRHNLFCKLLIILVSCMVLVRLRFLPSMLYQLVNLGKIVHIVIKAPNLVQSYSGVYWSILQGEPPCSCSVRAFFGVFSTPPYFFSKKKQVISSQIFFFTKYVYKTVY